MSMNYTLVAKEAEGETRLKTTVRWLKNTVIAILSVVCLGQFSLIVLMVLQDDDPPVVLQSAMDGGLEFVRAYNSNWFDGLDLTTKEEMALSKGMNWLDFREGYFAPSLLEDKKFMRATSADHVYAEYLRDVKRRQDEHGNSLQMKVTYITAEVFDTHMTIKIRVNYRHRSGETIEPTFHVATIAYEHKAPDTIRKRVLQRIRLNVEEFRVTDYRVSRYQVREEQYARTN